MGKIGNLKEGKTQEAESAMVEIRNVSAGYGKHRVLDGAQQRSLSDCGLPDYNKSKDIR